jgi:hypothetical protein
MHGAHSESKSERAAVAQTGRAMVASPRLKGLVKVLAKEAGLTAEDCV